MEELCHQKETAGELLRDDDEINDDNNFFYVIKKICLLQVILGLVFLWPIAIFMILYSIRHNLPTDYNPTCQFPARLMPHDGLLPFVQSFICSIPNTCDPLDEYEEIPSYKNATCVSVVHLYSPFLLFVVVVKK